MGEFNMDQPLITGNCGAIHRLFTSVFCFGCDSASMVFIANSFFCKGSGINHQAIPPLLGRGQVVEEDEKSHQRKQQCNMPFLPKRKKTAKLFAINFSNLWSYESVIPPLSW